MRNRNWLNQILGVGRDSMMQDELDQKYIGYKVAVRTNSKAFEPATSAALQSFRYRVNQETQREKSVNGAIAIFDTLDNARGFANDLDYKTHILEVEYVPSDDETLWKKNPPSFSKGYGGYIAHSNGITEKRKSVV